MPYSTAADLPDELGLLESPASKSADAQTIQPSSIRRSEDSRIAITTISSTGNQQNMITQQTISPVQQQHGSIEEPDRPKAAALKASSGGNEWRRRNAFPGKNLNAGTDRSIGSTKMKQIYVAKSLPTAQNHVKPSQDGWSESWEITSSLT